jgi:hypothetical protein
VETRTIFIFGFEEISRRGGRVRPLSTPHALAFRPEIGWLLSSERTESEWRNLQVQSVEGDAATPQNCFLLQPDCCSCGANFCQKSQSASNYFFSTVGASQVSPVRKHWDQRRKKRPSFRGVFSASFGSFVV